MNIYESITAIMAEGYAVAKDKKNQQQGFRYRGIDDVMNTFFPLLSKHKVFCVPEVLERTREERETNKGGNLLYSILKIKYTFYAEDGTSVSAVVIGEGMDSGDKASNKAMAVAMKYAMFQVFCIPTEEMSDPDAETPPESKPKEAVVKCSDCGEPITTVQKDGKIVKTAGDLIEGSKAMFGRAMCYKCVKSEMAAQERVKAAQEKAKQAAG